jgi:membrane protease YdiL (CAAX protease family)
VLILGALLSLLIGLCAGAAYQILARRSRPAPFFRGPSPLILFGIQVVGVNTVSLALLPLGAPAPDSPVGFLLAAIVLLLGYFLVVWLFGIRSGALNWDELGLPERPRVRRVFADIGVAAGTMLVVAVVAGLAGGLLARLLGTDAPEVVPLPTNTIELAMVALGAGILVPIGEELFFRGYALTAWLRDRGVRSALIRSTIFFALVHIVTLTSATFDEGLRQAALVVAVIAPVGLALGWLFVRRGLIAAIAGHAAFNLFGIFITVLAQNLPAPV